MSLQVIAAALLLAGSCCAQDWEFGGFIGDGAYHGGSVYSSEGTARAGILNRFSAGAVFGEDLYEYVSGEIRYIYQDGHPYLSFNGTRTDIQGQSQTITYDLLFHFKPRDSKWRPFLAGGLGLKDYVIAGPAPFPQPIPNIASLNGADEWLLVESVGGGIKYRLQQHMLLRLDFRDYITTFPKGEITPAPHNTARGIFEQFTPMFGISYLF